MLKKVIKSRTKAIKMYKYSCKKELQGREGKSDSSSLCLLLKVSHSSHYLGL
jgi:hypothetical protein